MAIINTELLETAAARTALAASEAAAQSVLIALINARFPADADRIDVRFSTSTSRTRYNVARRAGRLILTVHVGGDFAITINNMLESLRRMVDPMLGVRSKILEKIAAGTTLNDSELAEIRATLALLEK